VNPLGWVGVALVLAGAVALVIYREAARGHSLKLAGFLSDVKGEVLKITWPTKEELRKATMVILIFVVVVSLIIGTMDIILQFLLVRLPSGRGA